MPIHTLVNSAIFLCLSTIPIYGSLYYYSMPPTDSDRVEFTAIDQGDPIPENGVGWVREKMSFAGDDQHLFKSSQVIAKGTTPFQDYVFIKNASYGKMLFLDGVVQSTQSDEGLYHESLVQPAMLLHPMPRSVLVIGAGEGATAREILRHKMAERIVLIDIDAEVVQKTKELLTEWHEGAFDDPKVELMIMDGKEFVETTDEKFDVIIMDVCDKLEEGPAEELYSQGFYQSVKKILNPSGILVVQAMEMGDGSEGKDNRTVFRNIQSVFNKVAPYRVFIPSFLSTWGFVIASEDTIYHRPSQEIDQKLQERGLPSQLKHYDGQFHQHLFHLSKALRELLANEGCRAEALY